MTLPSRKNAPSPHRGCFLIANPTLVDPNFLRTVVLLCEHGDDGSMGLVINRPTEHPLADAIEGLPERAIQPLYWGGPVQQRLVLVLHREASDAPHTTPLTRGMALGTDHEALMRLLETLPNPEERLRVYSGYAGWGVGQLQQEMQQRSWLVTNAEPALVFDAAPHEVWSLALQQLGPRYAHLATMPPDPRVN